MEKLSLKSSKAAKEIIESVRWVLELPFISNFEMTYEMMVCDQ